MFVSPKVPGVLFCLVLLAFTSVALALLFGSHALSLEAVFKPFTGHALSMPQQIFFELRLPRALTAFFTGACLALAGAFMQILLRNPLADPYVLGTSGGASVGMLIGFIIGIPLMGLMVIAFCGAAVSLFILLMVSGFYRVSNTQKLVLVGVILATGWNALVIAILNLLPNQDLKSALFWMMGDLSLTPLSTGWLLLGITALFLILPLSRSLNVLRLGTDKAASLGISVRALQWSLLLISALLTAIAVSLAGNIGFVGLVVPHFIRLWLGSDHKLLLPSCILSGGSFVTLADTLARSIIAPQEWPVGVIMAFIGIPLFLAVLTRKTEAKS